MYIIYNELVYYIQGAPEKRVHLPFPNNSGTVSQLIFVPWPTITQARSLCRTPFLAGAHISNLTLSVNIMLAYIYGYGLGRYGIRKSPVVKIDSS